jgi:hypothetical protein
MKRRDGASPTTSPKDGGAERSRRTSVVQAKREELRAERKKMEGQKPKLKSVFLFDDGRDDVIDSDTDVEARAKILEDSMSDGSFGEECDEHAHAKSVGSDSLASTSSSESEQVAKLSQSDDEKVEEIVVDVEVDEDRIQS